MIYYIGNNLSIVDDAEVKQATIKDAYNYLKSKKVFGLDIETTKKYNLYKEEGLDPYTSEIVMIQVGDEHNQYIIDYRNTKELSKLGKLLADPKYTKVGHNLKFEYKHILHNTGIKIENLYDTMIAEQVMFSGLPRKYGLKELSKRYLKEEEEMNKETRLEFLTIGSKPFTITQIIYGAKDIVAPLKIKNLQKERITKYNLNKCIRLEMAFIPVLGDIEYRGMHFNKDKWIELYKDNKIKLDELKEKLDDSVLAEFPKDPRFIESQLDLFDDEIKCKINWGSSKQVIELFKELGFCPKEVSKTTGKLSYTVNAAVLKNTLLSVTNLRHVALIKTYLRYKETEQRCTTFGEDFLKYINPITKRVHSNYRQILNTGRISSSNPNLQNIPSDIEYRQCFDAPPNWKIVNADYSGQEQIILANKSKASNLLEFYNSGKSDMHSFVASSIYGQPYETYIAAKKNNLQSTFRDTRLKERQIAKAAGFAINYGGNGYTISKNLGISPEEGDRVYKNYFDAFPGLKYYFDKVQKKTLRDGYITIDNITNRKNFFFKPVTPKEIASIKRMALNFPIQGEAGSITKLAAILFRKHTINYTSTMFITNLVHDEINVEALGDGAEQSAAAILEECMEQAADYWCKTIPMKADAVVGDYWAH